MLGRMIKQWERDYDKHIILFIWLCMLICAKSSHVASSSGVMDMT